MRTLEVYESDRERTYHLVMNPVIDVHGDTATALSNWGYVTRSDTDAPVFEMLGHYVDELVRTPTAGSSSAARRTATSPTSHSKGSSDIPAAKRLTPPPAEPGL